MLDLGATTTWESFPKENEVFGNDRYLGGTCFGFGAHPFNYMIRNSLGVVPLEPGYRRFSVRIAPFDLKHANLLSTGLEMLAAGDIDVILLDLSLLDSRGFDTFARVHNQAPDVPIIVLTALADEALAVRAVQEGAQDYLVKGQAESDLLVQAMRHAIEHRQVEKAQSNQR